MDSALKNIAAIREEYTLSTLSESEVNPDPVLQFQVWFNEALNAEVSDVNAMTLSTIGSDSKPHSRIVLLKGVENNSFIFFTNYHSHKGLDIEIKPDVSLVFYWKELQRQVRIEGKAEKISASQSNEYFQSRPRESQLGAWASLQSEVLEDRETLQKRYHELDQKYLNTQIPKPEHWGGYAIHPSLIEFWQGRQSRLHDRLCYCRVADLSWEMKRLNP